MKKLNYILSIIFITTLISCSDNGNLPNKEISKEALLKESIRKKKLNEKFNISKSDYQEFTDNLIFDEKGNVIGAIYDKIEKNLDNKSSNLFWSNFKMKIRKDKKGDIAFRNTLRMAPPTIFEGFKPKRGGCRANSRWICVIREY